MFFLHVRLVSFHLAQTCCLLLFLQHYSHFFLSINRFERKKDLRLTLRSYSKLRRDVFTADGYEFRLILAGGYDERLIENVEYFEELER